jgi:hypothetical protein
VSSVCRTHAVHRDDNGVFCPTQFRHETDRAAAEAVTLKQVLPTADFGITLPLHDPTGQDRALNVEDRESIGLSSSSAWSVNTTSPRRTASHIRL